MNAPKQGRAVLIEGKPYARQADGSLVPLAGQTDFARLDAMTEQEVESAAQSDPDALPMSDSEWAHGEIIRPTKIPIAMKLDNDVLDWFKGNGKGYQTRINTVLRKCMEAHRKAG
jgi:uncharacterized protein (DUF4415 family)